MGICLGKPTLPEELERLAMAVKGYCACQYDDGFLSYVSSTLAADFCLSVLKHASSLGDSEDMTALAISRIRKLFEDGKFSPKICDEINFAFPAFLQKATHGLRGGYQDIVKGNVTIDMFLKITPIAFDVDSTRGKY